MSMVDTEPQADLGLSRELLEDGDGLGACRGAFWALVIELAVLGPLALGIGWFW